MDFIEFRYEDAITNFDQTYRKVFDFINIPWDSSVTDFHKMAAKKFIVSPSFNQVSQPLYSSSVARWRNYEADFTAINPTLQPFVELYRDKDVLWAIHPFLFETKRSDITSDWEHDEYKWIYPDEIKNYSCVPKLGETVYSVI